MTHQHTNVNSRADVFNGIEVFGKGFKGPVVAQSRVEGGGAHALDFFQGADNQIALTGPCGCDTKTTVTENDGGYAVPG